MRKLPSNEIREGKTGGKVALGGVRERGGGGGLIEICNLKKKKCVKIGGGGNRRIVMKRLKCRDGLGVAGRRYRTRKLNIFFNIYLPCTIKLDI